MKGGEGMRTFNYSAIKEQKWDSDILGLIAANSNEKRFPSGTGESSPKTGWEAFLTT